MQVTPLRTILASSPKSKCASEMTYIVLSGALSSTPTNSCPQGHAGSITLLQQKHPVLNWGCWPVQFVLYSGCEIVDILAVYAAAASNITRQPVCSSCGKVSLKLYWMLSMLLLQCTRIALFCCLQLTRHSCKKNVGEKTFKMWKNNKNRLKT